MCVCVCGLVVNGELQRGECKSTDGDEGSAVIMTITRACPTPLGRGLYATFWPANPSPTRIDTGEASVGCVPSDFS